jgi:predicted CoA-binding protein
VSTVPARRESFSIGNGYLWRIGSMSPTARHLVNEFLTLKRFAMVGVSHDPKDFSRRLYEELCRRGYDVIPVNPSVEYVDGKPCFARVQDIRPPVTSALLMTSQSVTDHVLHDCADAGITLVWIYGISGVKSVSPSAQRICGENGIKVVTGYCPFMFFHDAPFFHRLHGFALKLTGRYPR